jgi:uncharacterized protein (TIGR02145 family)
MLLFITFGACKRDVIQLFTATVTSVTDDTALCGGDVTDDGGHGIVAKGVCWSTNKRPTINDSFLIADKAGAGKFTCQLTGLQPNTTYYVRAYATCDKGTFYGNEQVFTTSENATGTGTVTDIDGNTYKTVTIGNQTWMAENLRTTRYADGTPIPDGTPDTAYSYQDPYRYEFDYGNSNLPVQYGLLYNWHAATRGKAGNLSPSGVQGACPDGWHLPSQLEWEIFSNQLREMGYEYEGNYNYIAKALASQTGWEKSSDLGDIGNDPASNNATGFSALPTGYYHYYYNMQTTHLSNEVFDYRNKGEFTGFWTSNEIGHVTGNYISFYYQQPALYIYSINKRDALSVRCMKD